MRRRHPHRSLSLALVFAHVFTFLGPADLLRVGGWRLPVGASRAQAQAAPPPATVGLEAGTNLFAFPREVPPEADTCFELLTFLGGPGVVSRVARLDPLTQQYSECTFAAGGAPAGIDFPVAEGEGYVVDMLAPAEVVLSTTASCPALDLEPGVNLVGVSAPFVDQSCFDVLQDLGEGTISASERLNRVTGRGEVCAFDPDDGQTDLPGGRDYSIVPGEGYLLHLEQAVSGYQPNDLAMCSGVCGDGVVNLGEECDGATDLMCPGQCSAACTCPALTCQPPDPSQGPPGAVVTLRGTGFLPGSTTVTFNGQPVSPGFASPTRLDVTVPAGVTAGPVGVTVDYPTGTDTVSCGAFTPNAGPMLDPIGDRTVLLGQQIEFTVTASDPDPGQELTLSVTPAPLPVGATFEPLTGVFRFQPVMGQGGMSFDLTFRASDGQLEATETVTVTVQTPLQTTLSGSVLSTTDLCSLEGVVLTAGADGGPQATSTTDAAGRFNLLLDGVPTDGDGLTPMIVDATAPGVTRHCPGGIDTVFNQNPAFADLPQIREAVRLLPDAANVVNCKPGRLCLDGERPLLMPVLANAEGTDIVPTQDVMVQSPAIGYCEPDALGVSARCDPAGDADLQCGTGRACNAVGTIQMEVAAGSAKDALSCTNPADPQTCTDFTGRASLTPVSNDRSPIDLPDEFDFSVYMAVQPFNVTYDPPQPICMPNVDGFPDGSSMDIFAMDPDLGEFIRLGGATVCPDASNPTCAGKDNSVFCSVGGIVRFGSWHGGAPPPPEDEKGQGQDAPGPDVPRSCNNSAVCMRTGDLEVRHDLPSYRTLGAERRVSLAYHSTHAFPSTYLDRFWTPGGAAPPPLSMSTRFKVAGVEQGREVFHSPQGCATGLCRFARQGDASSLATGVYPAELTLNCNFPVSRRSETHTDVLPVVNQITSPYGAGWSIEGLERIHPSATGDFLLTDGRTEPLIFTPALRATAGIGRAGEQDVYQFAANRGEVVSLRMKRKSNQPDGSSSLDPQLELRDSRGFVLAQDDDSGESIVAGPGTSEDAEIAGFTLPATDTYTVVARGANATTGPYELLFTTASDTPLVEGQSQAPQGVQPAFTFTDAIGSQGTVTHTLAASVGSRVTIEVDRLASQAGGSGSLDPAIELRTSQGFVLASNDESGGDQPPGPGRNALITGLTLPATDTYTLAVSGAGGTTGPYQVNVLFADATGPLQVADAGSLVLERVVESPTGEFSELRETAAGFERRMKSGTVKVFDAAGLLERATDRNGNTTSYAYDASDRLVSITDPVGQVTQLRYDVAGSGSAAACAQALDEIEDPAGRITRFVHDAECNLLSITQPDDTVRRFGYDVRHLLTRKTSPRGETTPNDPDDFTTFYTYDDAGRILDVVRPGSLTPRIFDPSRGGGGGATGGSGNAVPPPKLAVCIQDNPDFWCPGLPGPAPSQAQLNVLFRDSEGHETSFGRLGPQGNALSITDPSARALTIDRDPAGNPISTSLGGMALFGRSYDETANLRQLALAGLRGTYELEPDSNGLVTSVTNPLGNRTRVLRDENGNLLELAPSDGTPVSVSRNNVGQPLTIDDGPAMTELTYGPRGMLAAIRTRTTTDERVTLLARTSFGAIAAIEDAMGRLTAFSYDDAGRTISQTFPDDEVVEFVYDDDGNLSSVTPPGRPPHLLTSSPTGRVVTYTPPAVGQFDPATNFAYNAEDELARVDHPDGRSIVVARLPSGEITTVTTPIGSYSLAYSSFTGVLESIQTPAGDLLTFLYDGLLRVGEILSGSVSGRVDWTLDSAGRISGRSVNGGAGVTFEYDDSGRLVRAGALELDRDDVSGLVSRTRLDEAETLTEYNGFLEPTLLELRVAGALVASLSYERDALGRVTTTSEQIAGGPVVERTYGYDLQGRLIEVRRDGVLEEMYSYDPNGNRVFEQTADRSVVSVYDAQDRLVTRGGEGWSYNENGDAVRVEDQFGQVQTLEFDVFGNLTQVAQPNGSVLDYTIGPRHRRLAKRRDGESVAAFLYKDQRNPVAELEADGSLKSRFVFGHRPFVPAYLESDDARYVIFTDAMGSVRLVVDSNSGQIAQQLEYSAFGKITQDTSPGFQPFAFAGGLADQDTGFIRFGRREYDPRTGRWLTKDPFLFGGGDVNLYQYSGSDPVNNSDRVGALFDRVSDVDGIIENKRAECERLRRQGQHIDAEICKNELNELERKSGSNRAQQFMEDLVETVCRLGVDGGVGKIKKRAGEKSGIPGLEALSDFGLADRLCEKVKCWVLDDSFCDCPDEESGGNADD